MIVVLGVGAVLPGLVQGQTPERMGPALARSADWFTHIFEVKELPDGRILLSDSRDRSIAIVDLRSDTIERLGRQGRGPREFLSAFTILSLEGGRFAVYDAVQRRLSLVSREGGLLEAGSFELPPFSGFGPPRGPDRQGLWYIDRRTLDGATLRRDAVVYRWNPTTGGVDSVTTTRQYARGQEGIGFVPLPFGDAWSFLPDGSVVRLVAEENHFHAEWSGPDGAVSVGPNIPFRARPVGRREREAWVAKMLRQSAGSVRVEGNSASPSKALVARTLSDIDPNRFPDQMPPFEVGYTPSSPAGHVWVRLIGQSVSDETAFGLIDRSGKLAHRVALAGNSRVVGFGLGTVYLATRDDLDREWLEQYRYPGG